MKVYKVRDEEGTVIDQRISHSEPSKPHEWDGEWIAEEVDLSDLNNEPVEWWDEQ